MDGTDAAIRLTALTLAADLTDKASNQSTMQLVESIYEWLKKSQDIEGTLEVQRVVN